MDLPAEGLSNDPVRWAMQGRLPKWLFALVFVFLIGSSVAQRYLGHVMASPDLDFYDYFFAAQIVHDHPRADIYAGATEGNPQLKSAPESSEIFQRARAAGFADVELYLYPPLLADVLAPVSRLPPHVAAALWRAFNLCLVAAAALLIARMLLLPVLSARFAVLLVSAFSFWPVNETIALGQISIVLLMLWVIGVVAYAEDRPALSALSLALATALKVSPILIVGLFLVWNDRRWVAWYAAGLASLILLMGLVNGWSNLAAYREVISVMSAGANALQNKSIGSMLASFYYGSVGSVGTSYRPVQAGKVFLTVSKIVSAGFMGAMLWLAWLRRRASTLHERAVMLAVFSLVLAVVSPVSWRHGYTVALIPFAILWEHSLRVRPARRTLRIVLLTLASITVGTLCFDLAARLPLPKFVLALAGGTWVVFCMALAAEVLWNGVSSTALAQES